jgi:beta-glucosidase
MNAAETVQVYAEPPKGQVARAPRELRAFKKVSLAPGQSQRVTMSFDRKDLAWYDVRSKQWVVDPGTYRLRIGTSSRSLPLTVAVKVP